VKAFEYFPHDLGGHENRKKLQQERLWTLWHC
jgi:hypothetical protein